MMKNICIYLFLFVLSIPSLCAQGNKETAPASPIIFKNGELVYTKDDKGNRVPDFSYAGYKAGNEPIPNLPVNVVIPNIEGDATAIIQQALDYAGSLKPAKNGFRAVVLLQSGNYNISGTLIMRHSGVVLRGCGTNDKGTQLSAAGKDRRTIIRVLGKSDRILKSSVNITDSYVPVNSSELTLSSTEGLHVGSSVLIHRPSSKEWIDTLGTNHFGGGITSLGWKAGEQDIYWDRTIVSISGNRITLDVPITTALDITFGQSDVIPYSWNERISDIGIENLTIVSDYDKKKPKDEAHSWTGITIENTADGWVRNVNFRHFAGSAVMVLESAKRITVENCKSLQPVSEIGGQRRYAFFTSGQQCLFQRLYSENAYHDFGLGFCAPGPNAFVQCYAEQPFSFSGPLDSWASGVLFDNVNISGNALRYTNRGQDAQGAGWNAANSVFWQCTASMIECMSPPTAQNWAFGSWSQFSGNGYWENSNNYINPPSLYYAQLKKRLGNNYTDRSYLRPSETEASSSPSIQTASMLTDKAVKPETTLYEWIDTLIAKYPIATDYNNSMIFEYKPTTDKGLKPINGLSLANGWLTNGTSLLTGLKHDVPWWNGTVQPAYLKKTAKPHITRFVPGRTGTGLTDDLDSVGVWMKQNNILSIDHNYGLWYERRRDDHERVRRMDGEVWAPFYEQPFARSGEGTAYDGLSKYDLNSYNDWYWRRLKQFADLADRNNLVLLHQNYFQHNIIEAGAHWADTPWRPANNINNTGFPEPVPYAGGKRIFFAEQFYDVTNPVRRQLHKAYIRQCLDNFKDNTNVVQLVSAEYTGPLGFVQFWLDVIAEWEQETGRKPLIALSATKDVQDAILADPSRAKIVDVIDIRYWHYRNDGSAYAPEGGKNLAPRQHARLVKPGKVSFASVYRAVSEYRNANTEKAVTYFSASYVEYAWAVFMAGGSFASIPRVGNNKFLEAVTDMNILTEMNLENQYVLGGKNGYIVYTDNGHASLNLTKDIATFDVYWIDKDSGTVTKNKKTVKGGKQIALDSPSPKNTILWLAKK